MRKAFSAMVLGTALSVNVVALFCTVNPKVAGMVVLFTILVTFFVLGLTKWRD